MDSFILHLMVAVGVIVVNVLPVWGLSAYLDRRDRRRFQPE